MSFADTLKTLPEARGTRLRLADATGAEVAVIENGPGTAGSFRVYAYLADKHDGITPAAAAEGLAIFAEHSDDARKHAGKHPNIDRLLALQASGATLTVRVE
ncbi:MAG: DUF2322 family protein [Sulfuriferula multivorans]|uniref:DUF2322 family protein n=1 Tax=Sulfuriferula multivorans TaxID=1559896 RepID=A0A7C9TB29_9PROT|nr:DUF2322 family protein [Sulfuriferula multivorans]